MLDDLGLLPALRNYVKNYIERTGIAVRLDMTQSENIEQLDSERKVVVYPDCPGGPQQRRQARQRATRRWSSSPARKHDVRIQLGDNGRGFVPGVRPDKRTPAAGPARPRRARPPRGRRIFHHVDARPRDRPSAPPSLLRLFSVHRLALPPKGPKS
ncbi:MAG: hypothetical protein WDM96_17855 [Lacunisphaera sp.]